MLIEQEIEQSKIQKILKWLADNRVEFENPVGVDVPSFFEATFENLGSVGKGGYGSVYKCRHKLDRLLYAVKKAPLNQDNYHESIREVTTMASMQHPYVVRYHQSWLESGFVPTPDSTEYAPDDSDASQTLYIAMSYCPKVLHEIIGAVDRRTAWRYFKQMLEALKCIHDYGIVHGDLKPNNVLLDAEDNVQIADFGRALFPGDILRASSLDITFNPYRSPEMEKQPPMLDAKTDIFALGLILFEMLHPVAERKILKNAFNEIRKECFDWKKADAEFVPYVPMLFAADPDKRASATDLLRFGHGLGAGF